MEVTLHGVRGSISTSSMDTVYYGGNTTCIEARTRDGGLFIFDAGSGLRSLGMTLPRRGECRLFISHVHADHIQGLGFFAPLHSPEWTTHIYLPEWAERLPDLLFTTGLFPLPFSSFKGSIVPHFIAPGEELSFSGPAESCRMEVLESHHPGKCLGFRLHADHAVLYYSGDHEITASQASREATLRMLEGCDIAVVDAMFSRQDKQDGWGHSAVEDWLEIASKTTHPISALVLSHHAPSRTDRELDALRRHTGPIYRNGKGAVYVGRENMRFRPPYDHHHPARGSDWLDRFLHDLRRYKDDNTIIDRILAKAREITGADAGTVFHVENDELVFAYTHNDSLYPVGGLAGSAYATLRLPISQSSVAGYAADTGEPLNIPDVRSLPPGAPYRFNADFDSSTGYYTRSMLTVPFHDHTGKVSGVIQLINSLDRLTGEPVPFSPEMQRLIAMLAKEAAIVLERSTLLRKNIYALLRMAAVHDPVETGPHAERVGAIAAELYQYRADKLRIDTDTARFEKSAIRLAAMLHDVGKVGISDLLLKKPGRLTDEEFTIIRSHTQIGASILEAGGEDLSGLARDIALHHHQKWNGLGYAGPTDDGRLAGEDIPLAARITALADVFDALVSPRCYKRAWTFQEALDLLHKESGQHFDPLLVGCMEGIADILDMIYQRFPDVDLAQPHDQRQ